VFIRSVLSGFFISMSLHPNLLGTYMDLCKCTFMSIHICLSVHLCPYVPVKVLLWHMRGCQIWLQCSFYKLNFACVHCACVCIYTHTHTYIYVYDKYVCIHVCVYVHVSGLQKSFLGISFTYIYIYIYIHTFLFDYILYLWVF
jgi:hypothetical protein